MAVQFLMSGGNFFFSQGINVAGIWAAVGQVINTNSAPLGRGSPYAFITTGAGGQLVCPAFSTNYSGMIAGFAYYPTSYHNTALISFYSNAAAAQYELRSTVSGQLYFTKNGVTISGNSTVAYYTNAWSYFEFKSVSGSLCEVRVNGGVVLTQSIATGGSYGAVAYGTVGSVQGYMTDFYVLDTATGVNMNYLGDVSVQEIYPIGAGVNSQWTANVGPFSITSVAAGTGVYTGTITGGASNAYQGYYFVTSTFAQSANNGTFLCTASTALALTLANASSQTDTTGSAAFQSIVQPGIYGGTVAGSNTTNVGTRPNQDVTYISDATSGHISDFAHQTFASTNSSIAAITHVTYARKDDVGTREIAQAVLLGGTTALNNVFLSNSYVYYLQVMDGDPNSNPWTIINYNSTTSGAKEIT